jgi:hypothetical protein
MKRTGMPLMQQSRELFPLSSPSLHGGLEQRFLDVARHVAPHVHRRPSQQARKMIRSIAHSVLLICPREWNSRGRAAFQFVEHYEMCRYGTLIAWAEELGHDDIVRFLTANLNEAKTANTVLMARVR